MVGFHEDRSEYSGFDENRDFLGRVNNSEILKELLTLRI
jgi:hypothetical protein